MMKILKNRFLLKGFLLLLMAIPTTVKAQNFSRYNWYFGSANQAIRFSRSDNAANLINYVPNPTSLGPGGSSVASSKLNGDLLFFTDGVSVFDRSNQQINATPLNGNANSNQPVAIAKVPGQVNQYYIFTNSASNTTSGNIEFSIVDMSLPGNSIAPAPPSGAMLSPAPTGLLTGRSEAMITVPHSNGEDFWLITHANGTPDFTVVEFTSGGPGTITNFNGFGLIQVAANFSYHEATGRIAVSPQETTRDIEIFDFNSTNGLLTSNLRVLNSGVSTTLGQAIYDTEWSNSGQYLYVSVHGDPGVPIQADVLQFDFLAASSGQTPTLTSVLPSPNTIFRSYGLQMAPDSAIYHLYQQASGGPFFLGKLTNTDTIPAEVIYTAQSFPGTINFGGLQFPSFAPSDTTGINISIQPVTACANTPVTFNPVVSPGADSIVWDFGDGSGGSGWSPVYTYTADGSYQVTATAFLNGQSVTSAPQTATISQFDLQLSLVQDTTACVCEYKPPVGSSCNGGPFQVTVQAQNGSPTYQWFGPAGLMAGQTTATLTPDSAGYYYVIATVGACSTHAGVNIKTYDSLDQRANIWYFGQNAGLDFNGLPNDPVVAISNPVMDTPEGTSTISDRNGQVIFFTDGDKVWNRTNAEIASGIGGSNNSTQSSLIVPFPGDETLYYIFTTTAIDGIPTTYELRYSVFDLKLNGGTGGLVDTDANPATFLGTLLFTKSTERITSNGNWLIAHEFGNNSFRAYPLTSLGIGNPVISSIGSDHVFTPVQNGQGYMELSPTGNLAVALSTPGTSNTVEIFDFIDSTGVVTNYRVADLKIPTGQVYGLEFSGSKLLTTWNDGTNSKIVEFFFNAGDTVYSVKQLPIDVAGEQLGAIQTGPDGQVYVAVEGATSLGTIQVNGDTTLASGFTLNGFALAGGTSSHLGLPNFVQILANPTQQPGINFTGVCLGNPTDFTASGKDSNIDKFDWTFGDGTAQVVDGGPQVSHTYAAPGTYTVTVHAYNKCEDPIPLPNGGQVTVVITAPPAPPTFLLPGDNPVLCTSSKILEATPATNPNLSNLNFLWTTGETTRTIIVNQQAIYGVTISDNLGCSSNGSLLIADNRPQVDLPVNTDVCQNIVLPLLDAQNPVLGTTYAWTISTNGGPAVPAGTIQQQAVDTSVPGVFEYEVTVTSPSGFGCSAKDSVIYTVKQAPIIANIVATPSGGCGSNTGAIAFDITGPTNTLYTYFVSGTTPIPSGTDQLVGPYNFPNLLAGTYGITVQDQVSFCFDTNIATINDPIVTPIVTVVSNCEPYEINVNAGAAPLPIAYRVINASTAQVVTSATNIGTTSFNVVFPLGNLPDNYIVELTAGPSGAECIVSTPPQPIGNPLITVGFDLSQICSGTLTATTSQPATTFVWTGTVVNPANSSTVTLIPGTGTVTVTASGVPAGFCPGTATTIITYENFIAAITQSDACQDQVTLDMSPTGSFTYQWTRNGVPFLGGQQVTATLADNDAMYIATATSTITGCPFTSPTLQAKVDGLLDVVFTNTAPCEGVPFTITATPSRVTNISTQWTFTPLNQSPTTLPDTDLDVVINGTSAATGNYLVTITSTNIGTCKATFDRDISVEKSTPGLLNDEARICPEGTDDVNHVILDPGAGFLSYNWFKEQIAIGETTQTLDVFEIGNYSVELENQFGCFSTDKTMVVEECDPVIVGPTAFRPTSTLQDQGEMVNQSFRLFTFFIADDDFQVFIFNRWGEMIYQTNQRDFRWNGGYNNDSGKQLPAGTYSYVVRYKSEYHPEEGVKEKHGGVVLLR